MTSKTKFIAGVPDVMNLIMCKCDKVVYEIYKFRIDVMNLVQILRILRGAYTFHSQKWRAPLTFPFQCRLVVISVGKLPNNVFSCVHVYSLRVGIGNFQFQHFPSSYLYRRTAVLTTNNTLIYQSEKENCM